MTDAVLLAIGAYFFGAIPTANVLALAFKRVDLRNYGSGAVTSSNAGELLGKWAVVTSGIADILKGAGPVWAAWALDLGGAERMTVGLAAIAGHNWSIYLRFQGGRGLATAIGVLLAAAPVEFLLFSFVALFFVAFLKNVPLVMGFSIALVPVWATVLREDAHIIWGTGIIVLLILAKRLAGNKLDSLPKEGKAQVLLYRFLYDRDTRDRLEWVRRRDPDQADQNP